MASRKRASAHRHITGQSRSRETATGYIRRIGAACEMLKTFPEVGRLLVTDESDL